MNELNATVTAFAYDPVTGQIGKEFAGDKLKQLPADAKPQLEVSAGHGKLVNQVITPNPETGGWRVSFELAPEGRARIKLDDAPLTETWTYRWTS